MAIWYVWARSGFVDLLDTCTSIGWVLQLSHMQITLYSNLLDSWFMGVEWGHNEGIILNYHIWIYTHMYGKLIFYSLTIMLQLYICIIFYISMQESWKCADSRLAWYPSLSSIVYLDHSIYAVYWIKKPYMLVRKNRWVQYA